MATSPEVFTDENPNKKVAMITGLGAKAAYFAPFVRLGEMFKDEGAVIEHVDGARWTDGRLVVASPLSQAEEVLEKTSPEDDLIVVSHSIGIVAAVKCLLERPQATAVAIAPPLPTPGTGVRHGVFLGRLKTVEDGYTFPTFSFAPENAHASTTKGKQTVDVFVPEGYFADVDAVSEGFADEVTDLVEQDRLRVVAARKDWNDIALEAAAGLKGTSYVETPHSLYVQPPELEVACTAIYAQARVLSGS